MRALRWLAIVCALGVSVIAYANGRAPMTNGVRFKPGDNQAIYVATTFGLLVSPDSCHFYWLCENDIGYGGEFDPPYAVTPSGAILAATFHGLRVSRDGGCSFVTATAQLPPSDPGNLSLLYLDALEVGPTGDVWVGTADSGSGNAVFRSTDDAVSFTVRGSLPPTMWFQSIKVAPSDPMRVYVTAFQISGNLMPPSPHFFRSDDAGASWNEAQLTGVQFASSPQIALKVVDPTNEDILYFVSPGSNAVSGDRVYRSPDGGVTFAEVLTTKYTISDIVVRDAQHVVVATQFDTSFQSSDGGVTFQPLVGAPQLACLGQRSDGVLFGCGTNFDPDQMALAQSADALTWRRELKFEYISGPHSCPAGTVEHDTCDNQLWRGFAQQMGITGSWSGCSAGPDTIVDGPQVDGAPTKSSGCCDSSGEPSTSVAGFLLVLGVLRRRATRS